MAAPPVLLDGAMGTLLGERGFDLRAPLFSARALLDAPDLLVELHGAYLRAGAQVLTTNSFNLHAQTLAQAGVGERQAELVATSVALLEPVRARAQAEAPGLARFRIAGAIPPRPRAVDDSPELARVEYARFARLLVDAGADLILLETFTDTGEAQRALEGLATLADEIPVWLSLVAGAPVPGRSRPDGTRLIGGEPVELVAALCDPEVASARPPARIPDAVLINCTQLDAVPAALDSLVAHVREPIPLGLSPHLGKRRHDGVWIERIVEPDAFARQIQAWIRARPRLILAGACCGSRPTEIAALRDLLWGDESARQQAFVRLAQLLP